MRDLSPVLFRGERDGKLRDTANFIRPIFFAEALDQAKLYSGNSEPFSCFVRGKKVLDLVDMDPRNAVHREFVASFSASFDDWTCRYSGENREAWSFIEVGDLYDYEGDGRGDRWNTLFRVALDEQGYDAVRIIDCTDGTNGQPSPVWVIQDATKMRKATIGEELASRVRTRPWEETKRWIERNCEGVLDRLSRLANTDADYRLDRLENAIPEDRLGAIGDRTKPRSVFRGLPAQFDIRPGDWIALDRTYAQQHERDGGAVKELKLVHPEDIYWSGTDESEFYFLPAAWRPAREGMRAEEHLKSLSDDQIRMLGDGERNLIARFQTEIAALLEVIMDNFDKEACGIWHGPEHWARVELHAASVARAEGIDPLIPSLFALVHDSKREDEGADPQHGPRAAQFIRERRDDLFAFLDHEQVTDLATACELHSNGMTQGNAQVRSCWDGDRLDLGRVDIEPVAGYLCTDYGKRDDVIYNACLLNGYHQEESARARRREYSR